MKRIELCDGPSLNLIHSASFIKLNSETKCLHIFKHIKEFILPWKVRQLIVDCQALKFSVPNRNKWGLQSSITENWMGPDGEKHHNFLAIFSLKLQYSSKTHLNLFKITRAKYTNKKQIIQNSWVTSTKIICFYLIFQKKIY